MRERSSLVPIDAFPSDVSVYGVRGMAGNARDVVGETSWTGEGSTARSYAMLRGGCWDFGEVSLRCWFRFGVEQTLVDGHLSFRVVAEPVRSRRS